MLYDYGCNSCGHEMKDVQQSIHDKALVKCPACGKNALERVPYGGLGSFMKNSSNTIGSQADKNWSNMGHYQKSELEAQNKSSVNANNKKQERTNINKMTPEQKTKYIITGEK